MKIKWHLYQNAVDNCYSITWVILRLKMESSYRVLPKKEMQSVNQRIHGFKRIKKIRVLEKRVSLQNKSKRILLSRIPLTNY